MENTIKQECKIHGESTFSYRKDGRYRCRKCSSDSVIKRRQELKKMSVNYKGGKCLLCGYNKCMSAMEFHHINPNEKDFQVSGKSISWEKIKIELDKCILVCSNCHQEIHSGLINIPR